MLCIGLANIAKAASAPSFDCNNASTTLETIICEDGIIASLDTQLADAYSKKAKALSAQEAKSLLSQQRQWLKRRYSECKISRGESDPTTDLQWAVAPCLAGLYRKRLADFGVTTSQPAADGGISARTGFIHPSCLYLVVGVGSWYQQNPDPPMKELPINACNKGRSHWPTRQNGKFITSLGNDDGDFGQEFGYWFAGRLEDGRELAVVSYWGGGAMFNTAVVAITKKTKSGQGWMSADVIYDGGDRANGGILDARPIAGGAIVEIEITPMDVLEEIGANSSDAQASGCTLCRAGSEEIVLNFAKKSESVSSIKIDRRMKNQTGSESLKCLDAVVDSRGSEYPHVFKEAQLASLKESFSNCMREQSPP